MKNITVYDYDEERINELCEKYDMSEYEVVELLLDNIEGQEETVFI